MGSVSEINFYCLGKLITFVCFRYVKHMCVCVCVYRQLKSSLPQPGVNATCSALVTSSPPFALFCLWRKTKFSLSSPPSWSLFLQHFTISTLPDDHFIHGSSWKDKYCLVECEAPTFLGQTKDEGKVSISDAPNSSMKSSSEPDREMVIVLRASSLCHAFIHIWQPKYLLCGLFGL